MIECYETGKDLYILCASKMLGKEFEEVKKMPNVGALRGEFKQTLLALIYG